MIPAQQHRNLMHIASALLQKNIQSLKLYCPQLYNRFIHYQPKEALFCLDDQLQANIMMNGQYLIQDHSLIQQQIKKFIEEPACIRFNIGDEQWRKSIYVHDFHLERLRHVFNKTDPADRCDYPEILPCLLFLGIGLGDQIKAIDESFPIDNIFIYEPSNDLFFASLHHIDYEPLLKKYSKDQRSIGFYIGTSPQVSCQEIVETLRNDLSYAGTEFFIFERHANLDAQSFGQQFLTTFHHGYGSLGFVEDELIGLKHVIEKLKKNALYINKAKTIIDQSIPAFIIGSGPSLDADLDFIRQHQQSAIIFSASSALEICFKNGILPDFHVEIERNKTIVDNKDRFKDSGFLEKVHLLGASTLHPDILGLFASENFALKSVDLATSMLSKLDLKPLEVLANTHPTSGNGAVSFALHLGFRTIALFGLDMGMPSSEQHHAKDTLYFESGTRWALKTIKANLSLPANFGGTVLSTFLLELSRHTLESSLKNTPDAKCFNTSDGAFIQGATPLRAQELGQFIPLKPIDKSTIVQNLLQDVRQIKDYPQLANTLYQYWIRLYMAIERTVSEFLAALPEKLESKKALFIVFQQQRSRAKVNFYHTPSLYALLNGTFLQLQNTTCTLLLSLKEGPEFTRVAAQLFSIWHEALYDCLELCRTFLSNETLEYDYNSIIKKYPEFAYNT